MIRKLFTYNPWLLQKIPGAQRLETIQMHLPPARPCCLAIHLFPAIRSHCLELLKSAPSQPWPTTSQTLLTEFAWLLFHKADGSCQISSTSFSKCHRFLQLYWSISTFSRVRGEKDCLPAAACLLRISLSLSLSLSFPLSPSFNLFSNDPILSLLKVLTPPTLTQ